MMAAGWIVRTLVAVSLCAFAAVPPAEAAPAPQAPAPQAAAVPAQAATSSARVFTGDAGMIFNVIKPDRADDFEKVIASLKDALAASTNPVHKAMANGWRVYRSTEPVAGGNILFVFVLDPAVKDADYSPSKILNDVYPEKVRELFPMYSASFAGGVTLQNHKLIADMKPVAAKIGEKK